MCKRQWESPLMLFTTCATDLTNFAVDHRASELQNSTALTAAVRQTFREVSISLRADLVQNVACDLNIDIVMPKALPQSLLPSANVHLF